MSTKSTTEKTEWPTIEEQQSYWRTKEADLSLDKVEATTDYYDHFLDGNPTSEIPFPFNETDNPVQVAEPIDGASVGHAITEGRTAGSNPATGEFDKPFYNYLSAVPVLVAEPLPTSTREPLITKLKCDEARESTRSNADSCGGAQNPHLSIEDRKGQSDSTLAEQKWAEPEWTLRDEVGESYKEIP